MGRSGGTPGLVLEKGGNVHVAVRITYRHLTMMIDALAHIEIRQRAHLVRAAGSRLCVTQPEYPYASRIKLVNHLGGALGFYPLLALPDFSIVGKSAKYSSSIRWMKM